MLCSLLRQPVQLGVELLHADAHAVDAAGLHRYELLAREQLRNALHRHRHGVDAREDGADDVHHARVLAGPHQDGRAAADVERLGRGAGEEVPEQLPLALEVIEIGIELLRAAERLYRKQAVAAAVRIGANAIGKAGVEREGRGLRAVPALALRHHARHRHAALLPEPRRGKAVQDAVDLPPPERIVDERPDIRTCCRKTLIHRDGPPHTISARCRW